MTNTLATALRRRTLTALVCAPAALALAACSSGGSGSTSSADKAPTATASSAPADPTAGLPTGTKLKSLLLPASALPRTLKADSSGDQDSGDTYGQPSNEKIPVSKACPGLNATNWIGSTGIGSDSFAGSDVTDSYGNMFAQQLDAFEGDGAQRAMAALRKVFTECKAFTIKQDGHSLHSKLSHRTLAGLGDDAVEAVITSPDFDGGDTLIAVRVGKVVVTTLAADQKTTGGYGLALTRKLAARVG